MGMGLGGTSWCLEKSEEWGAVAVNCSQPWWHSPGCSAGLRFTPWTRWSCLHLPLPPCPPAQEQWPSGLSPHSWLGCSLPRSCQVLGMQQPTGSSGFHGPPPGLGWQRWAVLGIRLPALADPWECPGWPIAGLTLGPFLLSNGDREMLKRRREGAHGLLPAAWWDWRKTVLAEGC